MRVTLCLDVLCESCEKNRSWFSPRVRFIDLFIYSFIWLALTLNARNGQIITRNLLFCTQYKRALRSLLPCVYLRVFVPVDRLPFFVHAHSHRSSLILCDTKSALHLRLSGSSEWDFYVLDHFLLILRRRLSLSFFFFCFNLLWIRLFRDGAGHAPLSMLANKRRTLCCVEVYKPVAIWLAVSSSFLYRRRGQSWRSHG